MYGYIYLTTNKINGMIYVGQRKSEKFQPHYLGSGKHFKHALSKYGKENFEVKQIDEALTPQELDDKEIYWIRYYNATDTSIGYNISGGGLVNRTMGGEHNPNYGKHWSEEWKQSQSIKAKERYGGHPERNPMYGKESAVKNMRWYTNGVEEVMAFDCPNGYHLGRSSKSKANISVGTILSVSERHWYTDGTHNTLCSDDNVPEGYYRGCRTLSDKIWINNSLVEKRIRRCEDIPDGYVRGRLNHKNTKG